MDMIIISIIVSVFFLFSIIYFSVRFAIKPLIDNSKKNFNNVVSNEINFGLKNLLDIGVVNESELKEIINIYNKEKYNPKINKQYEKYEKILKELRDMGYFTDGVYNDKLKVLKKHFN
ncbi:hypothetical protein CLPUN_04310 [Clostridium puniceum]|uniref:Uncharacterized protein n=1 Tax=Clostridium puniceum TaxID=29367 RepID=A0A1S8TXI0_9CLOT|nr:hypothetical protein [Clostridium puniceum]OOM82292.1 hypothetical protein CLPUN_04310 [Clostridium puniceum]